MKRVKNIIAIMLSLVMMLSVNCIELTKANAADVVPFAITSPYHYETVAAGYIDIEWEAATTSTVKNYEVYLDGKKIATTTNTKCEYYTTLVKYFDVYVKAIYTDGSTQNTATYTFGVSKKGLGLGKDMGENLNLYDMNLAWYYNWGTGPSAGGQYKGIEYVPMVWTSGSPSDIKNRINTFKSNGYKYALTFNEPDLRGQCDMPVADVYNVWQGLDGMSGIKISSPVTALWPSISTNWFQAFMKKLDSTDYDPDFISIHCYPDNYSGAGMAEWFVDEVVDWTWEKYGKPIWITEFSTTGRYVTAESTRAFWEAVMPLLDARPYVERYAAFGFNDSKTGLWMYSTGELTPAGEVYKNQGNPTSYDAITMEDIYGPSVNGNTNNNQNNNTNNNVSQTTVKKPAKAVIKSIKNVKKKKIKLTIKKAKRAVGYQVRWSDSKRFNGYWQKATKKRTYTIKKLDKGTRYYVKVRAYNMNNGKKQYGSWSKKKSVKIKK